MAIIQTGGKQYTVKPNQVIKIEKISGKSGDEVNFSDVLLVEDTQGVRVGDPKLSDAQVSAKILNQFRTKKVVGIKFKNKTRHRRKFGHRQEMTSIRIQSVA